MCDLLKIASRNSELHHGVVLILPMIDLTHKCHYPKIRDRQRSEVSHRETSEVESCETITPECEGSWRSQATGAPPSSPLALELQLEHTPTQTPRCRNNTSRANVHHPRLNTHQAMCQAMQEAESTEPATLLFTVEMVGVAGLVGGLIYQAGGALATFRVLARSLVLPYQVGGASKVIPWCH